MISFRMKAAAMAVVLGLGVVPVSGIAAGLGSSNTATSSPSEQELTQAKTELKAGRFDAALPILESAKAKDPNNADVHNLLGYTYRNLGNFDLAAASYDMALSIDPNHKQALEYQGEMFLKLGDLAKAEGNLKKLDGLCFFGCDEYTDLKKEIAEFRAKQSS